MPTSSQDAAQQSMDVDASRVMRDVTTLIHTRVDRIARKPLLIYTGGTPRGLYAKDMINGKGRMGLIQFGCRIRWAAPIHAQEIQPCWLAVELNAARKPGLKICSGFTEPKDDGLR